MPEGAKVLLVDDRPENLLALRATLEPMGHDLIEAASGEAALREVLRHDFAVILMDVQMPGMSGYEAAQLIKTRPRSAHVPIIFLTAIHKDEHHLFEGYAAGAVDYILKPFNPAVLRSKVHVFIELQARAQQIRRTASELGRQKRLNELILQNAAEGIIGIDRHGQVTFANAAAGALLGRSPDDMVGFPLHDAVHHTRPDGTPFPIEECPVHAAMVRGQVAAAADEIFWRADGTGFQVEYHSSPITERGQVTGAVVTFRDISERRRQEAALAEHARALEHANRQLREADRYKDEFLSVISHELRTPLNFIMGFGSILEDELAGPLNDQQRSYMERILYGADRMLSLVDDLLDFAKVQAGKLRLLRHEVRLADPVDEVLKALAPLAEAKGITLRADVDPGLAVDADDRRVTQVLTNVVGNGIKFTPNGGEVGVRAWPAGEDVVMEVHDTGIGIAAEDQADLFVRFKQLDMSSTREAGGTGLGLSITKALVEAHGGTIEVRSDGPGAGATFRFTLPRAIPAATEVMASEVMASEVTASEVPAQVGGGDRPT